MNHDFLLTFSTSQSVDAVSRRLPEICQRHQFGLLGTHDLKEKMTSKGFAFERECRVFEVCSPAQAHRVLSQAIAISTALPCRIAVYPEDGRTVLATLKPTRLLALFGADALAGVAEQVEASLVAIMRDAAA